MDFVLSIFVIFFFFIFTVDGSIGYFIHVRSSGGTIKEREQNLEDVIVLLVDVVLVKHRCWCFNSVNLQPLQQHMNI